MDGHCYFAFFFFFNHKKVVNHSVILLRVPSDCLIQGAGRGMLTQPILSFHTLVCNWLSQRPCPRAPSSSWSVGCELVNAFSWHQSQGRTPHHPWSVAPSPLPCWAPSSHVLWESQLAVGSTPCLTWRCCL